MIHSNFVVFNVTDDDSKTIQKTAINFDEANLKNDFLIKVKEKYESISNLLGKTFHVRCEVETDSSSKYEYNSHYNPSIVFETKFGQVISKHSI